MLQIFAIIDYTLVMNFGKKLQYDFPQMRGGGVNGHLELFQKFIRFGGARLPLWIKLGRTGFEISFFMRQEFNIFKAV